MCKKVCRVAEKIGVFFLILIICEQQEFFKVPLGLDTQGLSGILGGG